MEENKFQKYDFGKNCVVVGRVSTSSQSQTAQIEDLTKFAKTLGYTNIQPFFTTESGFLEVDNKQGWNLVTDFFESHTDYKVLICPEMSRLSRKENILFKIKEYLKDNRIQLIIKDINYRLFDEFGDIPKGNDIVFALYASLADSEMRQKKERFRRVLADNRKLGYSIGGKELFGYVRYYEKKDGKERSKYRINEDEAEQIKTIYRWYAFGIDGDLTKTSILEITKKCIEEGFSHYLHSKRNVNKCLKEKAYTGEKETHNRVQNAEYWNYKNPDTPKYIEGKAYICTYPPIFAGEDAVLFEKVQQRLKENNSKYNKGVPIDKSTQHITLLSKLLKCPSCGSYLHGEYRERTDKRRPNLGIRYYNTYRCNHSRGAVHVCEFKHILSMPMMDSIVWAYCKAAAVMIINRELRTKNQEQLEEIDKKISNLTSCIKDFNIEAKIKGEEAILRGKISRLKVQSEIDKAIKIYEANIANFDKELNGYEQRILELEQEKEDIKQSSTYFDIIARRKTLPTDKNFYYQCLHRVVENIRILFCDRYYTIIKISIKKHIPFYNPEEYLCIKKKTTRDIATLIVRPSNIPLGNTLFLKDDQREMHYSMNMISSKYCLTWNKEKAEFEIDGTSFSLERLFDYYNFPFSYSNQPPLERMLAMEMSLLHIRIKKLDVERLTCYEEDKKK